MRNDLCFDIGYKSILHTGEELCGDHVDIVEQEDGSIVIVLADGLGSGVKASILSTLTSKIISTMMAEGLSLKECVETIAATLPVRSEHGVAYSTFTIIQLMTDRTAKLIQYENPNTIMVRDGEIVDYPVNEREIEGKRILTSTIPLQENDMFVAMSDGCPYAGPDNTYNYEWGPQEIAEFMAQMSYTDYTAKALSALLVDMCRQYYAGNNRDDATACVVRVRRRQPVSVLFGPPAKMEDTERVAALFFEETGRHIVCGGTTASIAAAYLGQSVLEDPDYDSGSGIPPTSQIEGVDLVTEGVVTMSRVLTYAKDYLQDNLEYSKWSMSRDGAARISQMLFEQATDIHFFVGRAMNPAHQNPAMSLSFNIKMKIVEELSECLQKMGKKVRVDYF